MRRKIGEYVAVWMTRGYPDGIPDEADPVLETFNKAPSYRAICRAIMKNDVALLSLGYTRQPCEAYTTLKRAELAARGVVLRPQSTEYQFRFSFRESRP